jgi:hypothetical protein
MTDTEWRERIVEFIHVHAGLYQNAPGAVRYLVTGSRWDRLASTGLRWTRIGKTITQKRQRAGVRICSTNLDQALLSRKDNQKRITLTQDEWDDCHLRPPGMDDYALIDETYFVPRPDWVPSLQDFLYDPVWGLSLQHTWCNAQVLHIAAREFDRVTIPDYSWKDGSDVHAGLWNVVSPNEQADLDGVPTRNLASVAVNSK